MKVSHLWHGEFARLTVSESAVLLPDWRSLACTPATRRLLYRSLEVRQMQQEVFLDLKYDVATSAARAVQGKMLETPDLDHVTKVGWPVPGTAPASA